MDGLRDRVQKHLIKWALHSMHGGAVESVQELVEAELRSLAERLVRELRADENMQAEQVDRVENHMAKLDRGGTAEITPASHDLHDQASLERRLGRKGEE